MKTLITFLIFTIAFMNFYSGLPAQNKINKNDFIGKQKQFILSLYNEQRFFDCISETQRLLYFDDNNEERYIYFINACYYKGGQYNAVIGRYNDTHLADMRNISLLWHSYYLAGFGNKAHDLLFNIEYYAFNGDREIFFENRIEYFIREYEFNKIRHEIQMAEPFIHSENGIHLLTELIKDSEQYRNINMKSKWLSASLSAVIPGAGQVYSGRIIDGLISLAAVAGSAVCVYVSHEKNERSLMFTFSFLTGLLYAGNIFGAYNSAMAVNHEKNRRYSDKLLKKYDMSYDPIYGSDMDIFK